MTASPLTPREREVARRSDEEVAALAAEIANLCESFARQWQELGDARADVPAEYRTGEADEDARIQRSHANRLRAVFDRYATAPLPTGGPTP